jgi:hypothetical protein
VTKYTQVLPRLAHREHVGFSLEHLTLDKAQAWQVSRNLEAGEPLAGVKFGVVIFFFGKTMDNHKVLKTWGQLLGTYQEMCGSYYNPHRPVEVGNQSPVGMQ